MQKKWRDGDVWVLPHGWTWYDLQTWKSIYGRKHPNKVPLATAAGVVLVGVFKPLDTDTMLRRLEMMHGATPN